MDELGTPLVGGNLTNVWRVGDTVRRTAGPKSHIIQKLLYHLEAESFEGSPRALGFDERGREILSFIDGVVGVDLPAFVWAEDVLVDLGRLIRRLHNAATSFPHMQSDAWDAYVLEPSETICHNDIVPWNTVFQNGRPFAFIDWDFAAPGPRAADVAYAAASFVPFGNERVCESLGAPTGIDVQRRRLHLLLDAYGMVADRNLFNVLEARFDIMKREILRMANAGVESMERLVAVGGLSSINTGLEWLNGPGLAMLE